MAKWKGVTSLRFNQDQSKIFVFCVKLFFNDRIGINFIMNCLWQAASRVALTADLEYTTLILWLKNADIVSLIYYNSFDIDYLSILFSSSI